MKRRIGRKHSLGAARERRVVDWSLDQPYPPRYGTVEDAHLESFQETTGETRMESPSETKEETPARPYRPTGWWQIVAWSVLLRYDACSEVDLKNALEQRYNAPVRVEVDDRGQKVWHCGPHAVLKNTMTRELNRLRRRYDALKKAA